MAGCLVSVKVECSAGSMVDHSDYLLGSLKVQHLVVLKAEWKAEM